MRWLISCHRGQPSDSVTVLIEMNGPMLRLQPFRGREWYVRPVFYHQVLIASAIMD